MYSYFEKLLKPFPDHEPVQPPDTLLAFCLHYTKGMWGPIILVSFFTSIIAIAEASLFGLMGYIVDWLNASDPATFIQQEKTWLVILSIAILVVIPLIVSIH